MDKGYSNGLIPAGGQAVLTGSPKSFHQQLRWQGNGGRTRRDGSGSSNNLGLSTRIAMLDHLLPIENQLRVPPKNSSHVELYSKTLKYTLNMEQSLKKKKNACDRAIMCEAMEKGTGVIIECQAGMYELIKRASLLYFTENHRVDRNTFVELSQDRGGNHVQATIKSLYSSSGYNCYTISLFHTTSTIQINGKGAKKFLETEWPQIMSAVQEINDICKNTDPDTLNYRMKKLIHEALEVLKSRNLPQRQNRDRQNPRPNMEIASSEGNTTYPLSHSGKGYSDMLPPAPYTNEHHNGMNCMTNSPLRTLLNGPQESSPTRHTPLPLITSRPDVGTPTVPTKMPSDTTSLLRGSFTPNASPSRLEDSAPQANLLLHSNLITDATQDVNQVENITIPQVIHAADSSQSPPQVEEPNHHPPPNSSASGVLQQRDHSHPQDRISCFSCTQLKAEWDITEATIRQREKKLTQAEKLVKQREKEVEKQACQIETQKAVIAGLEAKVRELENTNRLLQQIIDATPNALHCRTPTPREANVSIEESLSDQVRSLKEELRLRDVESKMTEKIHSSEIRMMNQISQLLQRPRPPFSPIGQPILHQTPQVPMTHPNFTIHQGQPLFVPSHFPAPPPYQVIHDMHTRRHQNGIPTHASDYRAQPSRTNHNIRQAQSQFNENCVGRPRQEEVSEPPMAQKEGRQMQQPTNTNYDNPRGGKESIPLQKTSTTHTISTHINPSVEEGSDTSRILPSTPQPTKWKKHLLVLDEVSPCIPTADSVNHPRL